MSNQGKFEHKFAVGQPGGIRSSVWKLWGSKSDVYIQPRMMGSDSKISLHGSGVCQWSMTSEWLKKQPANSVKNAARHIVRWNLPEIQPQQAFLTFKIVIPHSELRTVGTSEYLKKVNWYPAPVAGHAFCVECYFTPPLNQPLDHRNFPYQHLVSYQLEDGKLLVALSHEEKMTDENLNLIKNAKLAIITMANEKGIKILPSYRACGFIQNEIGFKGLIELVPNGW